MKKIVILLLVLLLCVAIPMAAMAAEEKQGFGNAESVTAPRLYSEETEAPAQEFEGYESVTAPVVYDGDDTGLPGGTLAAIIVGAVAVVVMVAYFIVRKKT